ncbi:hypothetical protein [Ornithinimicrobium faecis]|uniref:hypothetical protein n=1 Tax=Ornithinimicrobium faecis TaxID=2934158 RepID=UPI0021181B6A|nr:hypothetical protein [Ornithinimicrobium sp. HY1793]
MMLVVMGVIIIGVWLTATRPASMADLQKALSSGQLSQVELVGELEPAAAGTSLVDIVWQDGLFARYTTVQQTSAGVLPEAPPPAPWPTSVVGSDLRDVLTASTPTGQLQVTSREVHAGSHGVLFEWRVSTWVAVAFMAWVLTVLVTLIVGPEPRRATRWAWFWLICGTGPFALVLFPLFGLAGAGKPLEPTGRRLTGGWAFLIAVLFPKPYL